MFKLDDKVIYRQGDYEYPGQIIKILPKGQSDFPLMVDLGDDIGVEFFTIDGKEDVNDTAPKLFHAMPFKMYIVPTTESSNEAV